jgi:hypothetical protein
MHRFVLCAFLAAPEAPLLLLLRKDVANRPKLSLAFGMRAHIDAEDRIDTTAYTAQD